MSERASILWLDDITPGDRARVGGKAAGLAVLRQAGLPVPDGFVVPADIELGAARTAGAHAYERLGGTVAVRSSAVHEDGREASFAGQYLSELEVHGVGAVSAALARCRGALESGAGYAQALGARTDGDLAVLVQQYVPARAAGVVFTRHPRSPERLVVESHAGVGEALVSGAVTPDRYVLSRESLEIVERPAAGSLNADDVRALARLALSAEAALGGPQDVEWVLDPEGTFRIVQSRPITVEAEAVRDPRLARLTRANVGEVLPDPVTPLTWSTVGRFLEDAFRSTAFDLGIAKGDPPPFLVLHQEHLYLNLTLCLDVAQGLPGVSAADAEALLLGGSRGWAPAARRSRLGALPRLLHVAVRALRDGRALPARIAAAEERLAGLTLPTAGTDAASLADALRAWLLAGPQIARAHVGASGSSGVRLALVGRLLARVAPGDPVALVNRLMAGLEGVESTAPTEALETLAAEAAGEPEWRTWLHRDPSARADDWAAGRAPAGLHERLCTFLARYGHRALSEGELRTRTWTDDPAPVLAALAHLAQGTREPGFSRQARTATRLADEQAILSRCAPPTRMLLRAAITGAQDWVRVRERTKALSVRLVDHGRHLVRAAGDLLVKRAGLAREDDVYFLTADELLDLLDGGRVSPPLIERRRRRHAQAVTVPVPREVDLSANAPAEPSSSAWQGLGVSAGIAVGRARVVERGTVTPLAAGEVLVAPVLDAAWGPHLAVAAGAVAEMGGMLSHGAVVARELGVPCVVDLPDATQRLRTGDTVLVDGSTGRVEILPPFAPGAALAEASAVHAEVCPADEAFHALEDHPRARESMYANVQDPASGLALVFSVGLRPGKKGEALLAIAASPEERLLSVALGAATLEATSLHVSAAEYSWSPLRVRFAGRAARHPAAGFPRAPMPLLLRRPRVEVRLDLAFTPTTPAVDFTTALSPEAREYLRPLGSHHVEQSGSWQGRLEIDGVAHEISGTGSRDHSWGLREWASADWWRLFTVRLGDDLAVHALLVSVRGHWVEGGFLWRGGRAERLTRVQFRPRLAGGRMEGVDLECTSAGGPPLVLRGTVLRTITVPVELARSPLRHLAGRPYALLLHENFTRYDAEGRTGYGMAEFTERR